MKARRIGKIFSLIAGQEYRQSKESVEVIEMKAEREVDIGINGRRKEEDIEVDIFY